MTVVIHRITWNLNALLFWLLMSLIFQITMLMMNNIFLLLWSISLWDIFFWVFIDCCNLLDLFLIIHLLIFSFIDDSWLTYSLNVLWGNFERLLRIAVLCALAFCSTFFFSSCKSHSSLMCLLTLLLLLVVFFILIDGGVIGVSDKLLDFLFGHSIEVNILLERIDHFLCYFTFCEGFNRTSLFLSWEVTQFWFGNKLFILLMLLKLL